MLDPVGVGSPALDRHLDIFCGQVFFGRSLRQGHKFLVAGKPEADDLADGQPGIQQLSGERVVTQVFFGADGAVLGF